MVAAYGLILPRRILCAPRLGCLNVHASLLPRWRGAAPIQRALLAGDTETGITIMQMEEGLDTGPILLQQAMPVAPGATAAGLSGALAGLGSRLILKALDGRADDTLMPRPQPQDGVTYARKFGREDGRLDWRCAATSLERQVRALDPWPGVYFESLARRGGGERVRCLPPLLCPVERGTRRGPCSTTTSRSLAAKVRFARCDCSGPAGLPSTPPIFCAAFRSPLGRCAVPRYKLTIEYDGTGFVGGNGRPMACRCRRRLKRPSPGSVASRSPFTARDALMQACTRSARPRIST